ncbi:MAG: MBL fold metallo-hydrolase, partial [Planctomycetes bacterium]|nr:MBL fold metallo-hydrolase [Planctomycetota bacterium]
MKLGNVEIIPISDGSFKLDGGAMFGVVPRVLWEKRMPPDDKNRISMGLWVLLIKTGGKNILVNTGIGTKCSERYRKIYDIRHPPDLLSGLAQNGLKPADINIVVLTHLHFDHSGGNTIYQNAECGVRNAECKAIPTFPNAKYVVQKAEWANATNPNERTRASYLQENIISLKEHGVLELIDGDKEIIPGIRVKITGGHTRGHQVVLFESEGKK